MLVLVPVAAKVDNDRAERFGADAMAPLVLDENGPFSIPKANLEEARDKQRHLPTREAASFVNIIAFTRAVRPFDAATYRCAVL